MYSDFLILNSVEKILRECDPGRIIIIFDVLTFYLYPYTVNDNQYNFKVTICKAIVGFSS